MPQSKLNPTRTTLKSLAEYCGVSKAAVSYVINESPGAKRIPRQTQELIREAARKLHYRPNYLAQALSRKRSRTIGVLIPEITEGHASLVLAGIDDHLNQQGYFYFVVSHHHREQLIAEYPQLLVQRGIEGLVVLDTAISVPVRVPVVAVSTFGEILRVTNIVMDHAHASMLLFDHLIGLGHRRIAVITQRKSSSGIASRRESILVAAEAHGIELLNRLVVEVDSSQNSPEVGYEATQQLIGSGEPFTALLAFNDIVAIGATKALLEAGVRVPEEVSIVGFDDVQSAAYQNPPLTAIRQPLRKMGSISAEKLLARIDEPSSVVDSKSVILEPELVVRTSSALASRPRLHI
jgi:DNA-binding LacI/PurR family transcriptional regulator